MEDQVGTSHNSMSKRVIRALSAVLVFVLTASELFASPKLVEITPLSPNQNEKIRRTIGAARILPDGVSRLKSGQPVSLSLRGKTQILRPLLKKHSSNIPTTNANHSFSIINVRGKGEEGETFVFSEVTLQNGKQATHLILFDHKKNRSTEILPSGQVVESESKHLPGCGTSISAQNNQRPRIQQRDAGSNSIANGASEPIKILVAYTPQALHASGGTPDDPSAILAEISTAVALTNISFENSSVDFELELAYIHSTDTNENGLNSTLELLTYSGDGKYDEIHDLRDEHDADLVALIVRDAGACGRGNIMQSLDGSDHKRAFSFSMLACTNSNYTFAHEIGHNLSLGHNRANAGDLENYLFDYGFGYNFRLNNLEGRKTLMAYGVELRIPYYSNPDVLYEGVPTGIPLAEADSADAARAIRQTLEIVRNYRPREETAPLPAPEHYLPVAVVPSIETIGGHPINVVTVRDHLGQPSAFHPVDFGSLYNSNGSFWARNWFYLQTDEEGKAYYFDPYGLQSSGDRVWRENIIGTLSDPIAPIELSENAENRSITALVFDTIPPSVSVAVFGGDNQPIPYHEFSLYHSDSENFGYELLTHWMTDDDGVAHLLNQISIEGFYRVYARGLDSSEFASFHSTPSVPVLELELDLPAGTLRGHLLTPSGNPVASSRIEIYRASFEGDELLASRYTNSNGEFSLRLQNVITADSYDSLHLRAEALNFPGVVQIITVYPQDFISQTVQWPEQVPGDVHIQTRFGILGAPLIQEWSCEVHARRDDQWTPIFSRTGLGCSNIQSYLYVEEGPFRAILRKENQIISESNFSLTEPIENLINIDLEWPSTLPGFFQATVSLAPIHPDLRSSVHCTLEVQDDVNWIVLESKVGSACGYLQYHLPEDSASPLRYRLLFLDQELYSSNFTPEDNSVPPDPPGSSEEEESNPDGDDTEEEEPNPGGENPPNSETENPGNSSDGEENESDSESGQPDNEIPEEQTSSCHIRQLKPSLNVNSETGEVHIVFPFCESANRYKLIATKVKRKRNRKRKKRIRTFNTNTPDENMNTLLRSGTWKLRYRLSSENGRFSKPSRKIKIKIQK